MLIIGCPLRAAFLYITKTALPYAAGQGGFSSCKRDNCSVYELIMQASETIFKVFETKSKFHETYLKIYEIKNLFMRSLINKRDNPTSNGYQTSFHSQPSNLTADCSDCTQLKLAVIDFSALRNCSCTRFFAGPPGTFRAATTDSGVNAS